MKKLFMTIMLTAGLYGLVSGQVGQSQSSQSQTDRSTTMQKDKDKMDGWEKIGEKTVDLNQDKGIFSWETDREKTINANEKYSAIKFKAKDATVNMTNVEVEFEDGKKQNLNLSGPVMANNESKVVQLESDDKKLDKITFNYKKDATAGTGSADKVKVELWGLKADASSGMGRKSRDIELDEDDSDIDIDRDTAILDRKNPGSRTRTQTDIDIDRSDAERSGNQNDRERRSTTTPIPR